MAVADALISKVLDLLVSNFQQDFRLVAGVEEEIQKFTSNLQSIQAVLADAERRQWKEATTVQLWFGRLKDIAYDIDDVVDEWTYEMLRSKIETGGNDHKSTRKVWSSSLLSSYYCFPSFVARHDVAVKISNLNTRLNGIAIEKDTYGFQSSSNNNEKVERNITTSDIDMSEVKGRDVEKEKLVNMLLAGGSEIRHLTAIVGMGGIGKTTLARLVYNDQRVKSHFHKRIWVCVSDPFDETRVAKEILEYLQGATNLVSLPNIMENIKESIKGKKILVVLDDVWNEDPKKWKQLEDCLQGDSLGISILVSTRNEKVGRIMGCSESDIFRIGLLSEQDSWELFCMIAFHMKSGGERTSLEKTGREIVERCKGLPLAIRAIAGLLRLKERKMEWQNILDSQLWGMEEVYRDIVGPLWLSYYDLPSSMKQCFLYCAIFPKDVEMEKYKLVSHWIAHSYIKGTDSKDMETIGEEYFQNLVMRSFFQDLEVRQTPYLVTKTMCKMHDIVHDFAQLQVKKECLSIEVNNDSETISLDESLGNL